MWMAAVHEEIALLSLVEGDLRAVLGEGIEKVAHARHGELHVNNQRRIFTHKKLILNEKEFNLEIRLA